MGATCSKKDKKFENILGDEICPELKSLEGLDINYVDECHQRYLEKKLHSRIDKEEFQYIFPKSNDGTEFALFADGHLAEASEIFASMSICSKSSINQILEWNFRQYDQEGRDLIGRTELIALMDNSVKGMSKMTKGVSPTPEMLDELFVSFFGTTRFTADDAIRFPMFLKTCQQNATIRSVIQKYPNILGNSAPKPQKTNSTGRQNAMKSAKVYDIRQGAAPSPPKQNTSSSKKQGPRTKALSSSLPRTSSSPTKLEVASGETGAQKSTNEARRRRQRHLRTEWKYPKEDVIALYNQFLGVDKDNSGSIGLMEFINSLPEQTQKFGQELFQLVDNDLSGEITFDELLGALYTKATPEEMKVLQGWVTEEARLQEVLRTKEAKMTKEQVQELREIFQLYDSDGNGVLSNAEIEEATKGLEGIIDASEFKQLLHQLEKKHAEEDKILQAATQPYLPAIKANKTNTANKGTISTSKQKSKRRISGVSFELFTKLFGRM